MVGSKPPVTLGSLRWLRSGNRPAVFFDDAVAFTVTLKGYERGSTRPEWLAVEFCHVALLP